MDFRMCSTEVRPGSPARSIAAHSAF